MEENSRTKIRTCGLRCRVEGTLLRIPFRLTDRWRCPPASPRRKEWEPWLASLPLRANKMVFCVNVPQISCILFHKKDDHFLATFHTVHFFKLVKIWVFRNCSPPLPLWENAVKMLAFILEEIPPFGKEWGWRGEKDFFLEFHCGYPLLMGRMSKRKWLIHVNMADSIAYSFISCDSALLSF